MFRVVWDHYQGISPSAATTPASFNTRGWGVWMTVWLKEST